MKNIFLTIFTAVILASCATSGSKTSTVQPNIDNTKWKLADDVRGSVPTLAIENGKVNGNAGCNNYFGEVTMNSDTGSLSAQNIGSTKKFCENMNVENNFLQMLEQIDRYMVNGNTLELYKGNLLLMKFNKQ